MKTFSLLIIVCLLAPISLPGQGAKDSSDTTPSQPSTPRNQPSPRDQAWQRVQGAIASRADKTATPANALDIADGAKNFYTEFPQDKEAIEARKLEALFLIEAADTGDAATKTRMRSTVQSFRSEKSLPAYPRAVVAGTFEFKQAAGKIHSMADMKREYEAVARGLIREFPDQPQGHVSLLSQATLRTGAEARAMAMEVVDAASAPTEARQAAQRLVNRLDLVGRRIDEVDTGLRQTGKAGNWKAGKPGLLFFWATWSPESVALGEKLKAQIPAGANVLAISLDTPNQPLELGTINPRPDDISSIASRLPGRLVELPGGLNDARAIRLGVNSAPMLYLVDTAGRITDVDGLADMDAKLQALGL